MISSLRFALGSCWLLGVAGPFALGAAGVRMWEERMVIPTYVAGDPEPNPMFYFGRASQGAEGRVYPYPLYDTLTGRKEARSYQIVYLENEYVRIGVLPQIGGRIFEGVDKSNGSAEDWWRTGAGVRVGGGSKAAEKT